MSVKLSELKVPGNAPRAERDSINEGLTFRQTTGMANRWVEICAVAALYWWQAAQDAIKKRHAYEVHGEVNPTLDKAGYEKWRTCIQEENAARKNQRFWQRAAFEGVEP